MWLTTIEWTGPSLNSRPGLYLLKDMINPQPVNGTGFYLEEASIRGKTVHTFNNFSMCNMAPTHSLRGFWFVPEELREEVEGEGVSLGLQNLAEQLQTPAGMAAETARPGGRDQSG